MNRIRGVGRGLVLIALAASAHARDVTTAQYAAKITRTTYGIPHIFAPDEASAAYAVGYAYAQDNLCLLLEEVLTVNGERALHFGADAIDGPDVASGSIHSKNLSSDLFFRLLNDDDSAARAWEAQSPEIKAVVRAYAAGFNRLVAEQRRTGTLPRTCGAAAWVRDITPIDLMKLMRRYASEASIRFLEGLVNAAPPTAATSTPAAASVAHEPVALGSNAVAFGKDFTTNGRGMLLANPHFPWYGSLRMYQMHLTVPGAMDVMGASLGGLPFVSIGFTRDFAWTHTVNTSSHYTIHALQLTAADPTRYVVDGQVRQLRKQTVGVEVRDESGRKKTVTHDFWISDYGPIVKLPGRLDWDRHTAYALRDANLDNARLLEGARAMNRAQTLAQFEAALKSSVGLPWVNTIAADRHGTALYANISVIPNVSDAQLASCVPERFQPLLAARKFVMFVLDGSRSQCNWQLDAAAAQPGIVPADRLPVLRRTDFVQNSNDSAWLTHPATPLVGYPSIVSGSHYPQNGRTRLGIRQLLAREGRISSDDVKAMALDNRSYHGPMLLRSLDAVCGRAPPATIAKGCDALRRWDGAAGLDSIGYAVAQAWLKELRGQEGVWVTPFDPSDPTHTPRDVAVGTPAALEAVRNGLARAAKTLSDEGVRLDAAWGEVQVAADGARLIPIHGGDAEDVYNVIDGKLSSGRKIVNTGTSYLSVVAFDAAGPVAEAVLTYSQSSDPASPHSADQTQLFSAKQWIRLPFTPEQVAAAAIGKPVELRR